MRAPRLLGPVLAGLVLVSACSGSGSPGEPSPSSSSAGASSSPAPSEQPGSADTGENPRPPVASPAPRPALGACYALTADQATAPTSGVQAQPCDRPHTSLTFQVGTVAEVVGGHLLSIDAERVQAGVAATCPRLLARFVGGTEEQRRLSTLAAVWFTPTLEQSDAGEDWFRCDVVAATGDGSLAELVGPVRRTLTTEAGRARYGICGTAAPGADGFRRVACPEPHAWRAIATYTLTQPAWPTSDQAAAVAEGPCEAAARARAADPLDFQWGYDWPSREEWADGRRYGLCWAPDPA